ncbi:hypothetical protein HMPREF1544_09326 [Mucor circinelloides 1006PhL]|uniref:Uncharacterized protein n=1 Tax=Mucor circinelloides f. circinelloides (strain 1006PhL) TaxID=1220926 RepID=S2J1J8_MUCC1|nr:hypothetical protein HMPREF1544_09326 [Mucor circinelloides 1006PhL]
MSDKSDIEDADITLNYPDSDIHQTEESDDIQQQEDDFGSFDDAVEDDDFGDFEEEDEDIDNTPIFNTMQDAMDLWHHLLDQIYHYEALDSFTGNAPKSIKQYVLEEAPESLHSRLTWDSVTRYMENDTGIPKVKWHQSEIERCHLNALACKRSATPVLSNTPTILNTEFTQEPQYMTNMKPALNTVIGSSVPSAAVAATAAELVVDEPATPDSSTTTSEKRSSVFGLSSLSRFLPHLSRTNLPKSPTTTTTAPTSPIIASKSLPRQNTTVNHLNVSTLKLQDARSSSVKRSNSVAFISNRESHTEKPRPTSFQSPPPQSMDLFDLTEDPAAIVKSPTKVQFSFEPLIPTHTLSPTPVRRNTIPANMHSDLNASFDTTQDDDFGNFTAEVKKGLGQEEDDDFGDFNQEKPAEPKPVNFIDDDPFDIWSSSSSNNKQLNTPLQKDNDPYGIASYSQPPPQPAQQSNHLISMDNSSFTPPSLAVASPKVMTPTTFDLLTPIAFGSNDQALGSNKSFDLLDTSNVSDQKPKANTETTVSDDDDWGDWTF